MKTMLISTCLAVSLAAGSASATEVYSDNSITSSLAGTNVKAMENLRDCLNADTKSVSSKSIRACTKAFKDSAPRYALRSEILARRGLLQLSNGKFEKAARDFSQASELDADNNLASLGFGFSALMQENTEVALAKFKECDEHGRFAPLASYGLGLALEQKGDAAAAAQAYERALALKPGWQAASKNLANLKAAI